MSFDLAVWKESGPLTPAEAQAMYERLADSLFFSPARSCKEMKAFSQELLKRWPYDKNDPDKCPFEDPRSSSRHQILNIAWSRAQEVAPEVIALALQFGLVCYDPQARSVHQRIPKPTQGGASVD